MHSHAHSNRRRCCGSSVVASRGEMEKNAASNSAIPLKKHPHLLTLWSGAKLSSHFHLDDGTRVTQSKPPTKVASRSAAFQHSPNRQAIPAMKTVLRCDGKFATCIASGSCVRD